MINEHEFRAGRRCAAAIKFLRQPREPKAPDAFAVWMRAETGRPTALATGFFPGAVDLSAPPATGPSDLARALLASGTPVARARFANATASCVVDFAVLTDRTLRVYQVVPKCIDLDRHRHGLEFRTPHGGIRAEWGEHLRLIALRTWILQPQAGSAYDRVLPFFILPVQGAVSRYEGLHGEIIEDNGAWKLTPAGAAIPAADFLRQVCVAGECKDFIPEVSAQAAALDATVTSAKPDRRYACRKCEVFEACWGPQAQVTPSLFDLGYLWFAQDRRGNRIADTLIRQGRLSLWDIPEDEITGEYADRQRLQLECERTGDEIRGEAREAAADVLRRYVRVDAVAMNMLHEHLILRLEEAEGFQAASSEDRAEVGQPSRPRPELCPP